MKVFKRGKNFYFRKRVPKAFHDVETRREICCVLDAKSEAAARKQASRRWTGLLSHWRKLQPEFTTGHFAEWDSAKARARQLGYRYIEVQDVAKLPIYELGERIDASFDAEGRPIMDGAHALLGTASRPVPTLPVLLEYYLAKTRDKVRGKSPSQAKLWRQKKIQAISSLHDAWGEVSLNSVNNDDLFDYQKKLVDRILAGEIGPSRANDLMAHADSIFEFCKFRLGYKFEASFRHLRIEIGHREKKAPSFSPRWIEKKLLQKDALAKLEPEARAILLGMVNTGYRLSEGAHLRKEDINLEADIPYIHIQSHQGSVGEPRRLKTPSANRQIPLCGVSLEALREFRGGFGRYTDRRSLSQKLNRFLRENDLAETEKHTVRGLRHAFSGRLTFIKTPDHIIRALMGHKQKSPHYGWTPVLCQKAEYLEKIAF